MSGCPLGFCTSRGFGGGALPCLLVSNTKGLFSVVKFFGFKGRSNVFFSGTGNRFLSTFAISRLRGALLLFAALGKVGFGALAGAATGLGGGGSRNVGGELLVKAGKAGLDCAVGKEITSETLIRKWIEAFLSN